MQGRLSSASSPTLCIGWKAIQGSCRQHWKAGKVEIDDLKNPAQNNCRFLSRCAASGNSKSCDSSSQVWPLQAATVFTLVARSRCALCVLRLYCIFSARSVFWFKPIVLNKIRCSVISVWSKMRMKTCRMKNVKPRNREKKEHKESQETICPSCSRNSWPRWAGTKLQWKCTWSRPKWPQQSSNKGNQAQESYQSREPSVGGAIVYQKWPHFYQAFRVQDGDPFLSMKMLTQWVSQKKVLTSALMG